MPALAGIRVLDLTHALAGPFCTQQLQLLGADVVKIEPAAGGDDFRARPAAFTAVNGGKRSVVLDLKSPAGQQAVRRLATRADVLVENFRPGVARSLGLDWPAMETLNPRLIYCSISGYGQTGPLREYPAIEWAVQAMSGMSAGYVPDSVDGAYLGLGVLDIFSGYVAFSAILAALLQRGQTQRGQLVDVAMLDAALTLLSPRVAAHFLGRDEGVPTERRPTMVRYRAADRRLFVAALHRRWFEKLCHIIGAPELLDDPRFADQGAQAAHADELIAAIEARLALRPAAAWEAELVAAGLPASVVRELTEVLAEPHVLARPALVELGLPDGGTTTVVGAAYRFATDGPAMQGPLPALGAHTDAVLRELDLDA